MTPQNPGVPLIIRQPTEYLCFILRDSFMSKNGDLGLHITLIKNVYFIQKGVNLQLSQNWVFYPNFYKIHNKAIYGHFFASETSDASHP